MSLLLSVTAAILLFFTADHATCQRYIVPEAELVFLSPRGLRISIPDIDEDVTLVAFHININEEFYALEHGQWAQDIIKKRDGRWSYQIPDFKVKQGDTIYYWIYVIVDNLGYQGLDRSYKVTQSNPHGSSQPSTVNTDRNPEAPSSCKRSATSYNGGISACWDSIILDKHFENTDGWSPQVQISGSQPEEEFMVWTKDSATSFIQNKNLVIKPILLEEKYDSAFVDSGSLTLDGCTSNVPYECSRQGASFLILPPIMSARLTTRNSFTFRYGEVEIRAKLPRGDWIVPELWLEPKGTASAGHVVCALSRGNTGVGVVENNNLLEVGLVTNTTSQLQHKTSTSQWSRDYHKFKLRWIQGLMVFSVDNEEIARLSTSNHHWLDQEMYITVGVHVAGGRDFSDNYPNKPWSNENTKRLVRFWNAKQDWHKTWSEDSALRVEYVKVTAV